MIPTIKIDLDTSKLDQLIGDLPRRAEIILTKRATQIQGTAERNTVRVDSSAMKNGWRVEQPGPLVRRIYNTQEYAIFHEWGTVKMSASPMLTPAVEQYRRELVADWAELFHE